MTATGLSPDFQRYRMIEDRLVNIETKVSFQDDLIDELNKTVYQQQLRLDQLEAICTSLTRHIQSLAEAGNIGKSVDERPPHY